MIHDWLVKDGGAKGDPTPWINEIAQKTSGWPQHISAYGDAASQQIKKDHRKMTPKGVKIVHRIGTERLEAYYKQRAKGISIKERFALAKLIKNIKSGNELGREDIETALLNEFNDSDKAKNLFTRAVERGILHSQEELYSIPIPSMHNWLISNYSSDSI
ncbi:MAG: hypothetical protein OXF08_10945 [Bacteroidetes bacterium]|nr:hypothetical protein [Bacteroidota bacterium]